jgi:zinc and cadmium transporter
MNSLIVWIILFCLLGGILSVMLAAVFLLIPPGIRARLLPGMVSFAIGTLLGAAFLGLLPHALEGFAGRDGGHAVMATVLGGLLVFFLLEKMVLWRHCHTNDCESHAPDTQHGHASAAGYLILFGDGIHNLVDGVLIAAAFLTDRHLGVITALAVVAHEIPQELGDFAILLHSGFSRGRALLFNALSGLTTVIGGVVSYYFLSDAQHIIPYVLAVAASSFIYIAVADLIPGLHKRLELHVTLQQIVLIASGVAIIQLTHAVLL